MSEPIRCSEDVLDGSVQGKFTEEEAQLVQVTIENYRLRENLSKEQLESKIFVNKQRKGNTFWKELVAALPGRNYNSVYTYARRAYNPLRNQGKWMDDEDQALTEAMSKPRSWKEVSKLVGRPPSECQDRWRNHVSIRENRGTGRWLATEVAKLKEAVNLVRGQTGAINWTKVSLSMGGIRSRQQCQEKWNQLSRSGQNAKKACWNDHDSRILIEKVKSIRASSVDQINWSSLSDKRWKGRQLENHWLKLIAKVEGYESKSHQEIVDALASSFNMHANSDQVGSSSRPGAFISEEDGAQ